MKKLYEAPKGEMEIIKAADIVTASGKISLFKGLGSDVADEDVHSFSSLFG